MDLFVFCSIAYLVFSIFPIQNGGEFTPAICFVWLTHYSLPTERLLRDSEPVRLLETPRSLSEYTLI